MYLYSVNRATTLAQREQLVTHFRKQLPSNLPAEQNWVVLDTCDRFELYCEQALAPELRFVLLGGSKAREATSPSSWLWSEGPAALEHLFRVVCGLDSPLFGEKAIQGQVKQAYLAAAKRHPLAKDLHLSFQSALRVGKRVRRETLLDSGAMSHVRATWEILCEEVLISGGTHDSAEDPAMRGGPLSVCFIGANQLNEDLLKLLQGEIMKGGENRLCKFFLGNRSFAKAEAACRRWGGQAFHLERLGELLGQCDVVFSATRAPHFVLRTQHLSNRCAQGKEQRPLHIFDLAMPRDVDPAVGQLPGVHLWNVADIEARITNNCKQRRTKAAEAEQIIAEELESFYAKFHDRQNIKRGQVPAACSAIAG